MCECLCSVTRGDIAIKTGDAWVTIDGYGGCEECAKLIGIDVSVYTAKGALEFASDVPFAHIEPDDHGGPNGQKVACFEMFSIEDLAEAGMLLGLRPDPDYDNWRDFMGDYGLKLVQSAMKLCAIRKRHQGEQR